MRNVNNLYFNYLCNIVTDRNKKSEYSMILKLLHSEEFYYTIELDDNRASDGIDLRSDFADCNGWDYRDVQEELDLGACTVLEMMVALSKRIEEGIMGDDYYGDRTQEWFWYMMESMGLDDFNNESFRTNWNTDMAIDIIDRMQRRRYHRDGRGGLFYVPGYAEDIRKKEIWYQMQAYINTLD